MFKYRKLIYFLGALFIISALLFIFDRPKTNNPKIGTDVIEIENPIEGSQIYSPLKISGYVIGTWVFEGSFPVEIIDDNGNSLVQTYLETEGDWMTDKKVPFSRTIEFNSKGISGKKGKIIFRKDNPSGLPENDASKSIDIEFK